VRTADNSVRHHNGPCFGRIDEREHFFCHAGIVADIGPFGEPAPKICGLGILRRNNPDRELGCRPIVRAVESDGSYGLAAKSFLSSLLSRLRARSIICSLPRVDDPLRLSEIGCRFFPGPERSRDCWLGRSRRCLSRWLASWRYRDLLLLLVPISGSPRIIPHRFSPSICSSC
jgi:hypothetical protein